MEGENLLNNPYEDITGDGQVMPNSEVHLSEETVTIDALDEENDDDLYTQGFVPGKNYGNERVQKAGKFLLTMKYICGVSQLHMPTVIEEAEALFEFVFDETAKKFSQLGYLPPGADVRSVKTEVCSVFDGLKTKHSQEKYLRESHEVTQPRYVTLDSKFQKVGEGRKRRVEIAEKNFVYIPIQEVVEKLVRHPDYPKLTERKCNPDPNVLDCYLKGDFAKKNPVLKEHPDALRFKTFYDDAEFCKDLSSRSSNNQKLGCFYMTLDNIDPKYQGNLDTMWLVALVNASFVKEHGLDFVLDRAVVDLKKFEEGVVINGKKTYGTLIAVEGDNLGLNFLGGFKCGFTATCPCRRCTMELGDIRAGKKVTQEQLRTPAQYDQHVEELESARTAKDRDQKSTKFGVNKGCVLNKLSSYHVVEGLPPDSLHDSLEGLLSRGVKNIINHCMDLNLMSLTWLNSAIKDFDYGYSEKTVKPSPLRDDHLKEDGKLHQSASQLWCLATILPLILGDLVDVEDEKWEHFLTILEINRIVFSSEINKSQLPYLSSLISAYFEGHIKFYGDLKPKDHFLSHYPDAWLQFGSIIDFTCFRGEANHQVLKRIMSLTGNYKNIPKTLAMRYQVRQALRWKEGLIQPPAYGVMKRKHLADLPYHHLFGGVTEVVLCSWVKTAGFLVKPETCYLTIGCDEDKNPVFAKVKDIIVWPEILFVCKLVGSVLYDTHVGAYKISDGETWRVCRPSDIVVRRVYHSHAVGSESKYIAMKECVKGITF